MGGWLIAVWVLAYYAFMAPSAISGQRYMLPVYPALLLLATIGIEGAAALIRASGRLRLARLWVVVAVVAVAAPAALDTIDATRLLVRRDTRLVARGWMLENLPPRSHLAREFYAPSFERDDPFRFSQPFSLTEHPLETYCKEDVDYLLLSSLNAERYFAGEPERFAEQRSWYRNLDERTRMVRRFEGIGDLDLHHPTIEVRRLFCPPGTADR